MHNSHLLHSNLLFDLKTSAAYSKPHLMMPSLLLLPLCYVCDVCSIHRQQCRRNQRHCHLPCQDWHYLAR